MRIVEYEITMKLRPLCLSESEGGAIKPSGLVRVLVVQLGFQ